MSSVSISGADPKGGLGQIPTNPSQCSSSTAHLSIGNEELPGSATVLKKPEWIRVKMGLAHSRYAATKDVLRRNRLESVCEQASCPNIGECFGQGTATFLIMGRVCTRACPFCDISHGKPQPLDAQEPIHIAQTTAELALKYLVITSVNRDELPDGGASHFCACIAAVRQASPQTHIEILTPDFKRHLETALQLLKNDPPDVFNHNLETVPRLYRQVRPGANYQSSLELLSRFKQWLPQVPTKSGLMVGLGESDEEILGVMRDLRDHGVTMLTIGQYLAPSKAHLPVLRYVTPQVFDRFKHQALEMGFAQVASAPLVRSSYHADQQAKRVLSKNDSQSA